MNTVSKKTQMTDALSQGSDMSWQEEPHGESHSMLRDSRNDTSQLLTFFISVSSPGTNQHGRSSSMQSQHWAHRVHTEEDDQNQDPADHSALNISFSKEAELRLSEEHHISQFI